MFYIRWETPSQKPRAWKLRNWKWLWYMYRCKPACAPLFSCAHSIVKLRAMVIHVRVYARRLTIHIHFTQAQPCRNYRYMPRSWPYTELRNGKKRGIDQSETSSHLTHLIYVHNTGGTRYNEILGTRKFCLLYQISCYIRSLYIEFLLYCN